MNTISKLTAPLDMPDQLPPQDDITLPPEPDKDETGEVISVKDGVVFVDGLESLTVGELVQFANNTLGMALNLEENQVGCIIFGNESSISQGDTVIRLGRQVSVPVGIQLLGRVVNALGEFIDGKDTPYDLVDEENETNPESSSEELNIGVQKEVESETISDINASDTQSETNEEEIDNESDSTTEDDSIPEGKRTVIVQYMNVERKAPGVITRLSVSEPLLTGYKVVDSLLPIGRGQRELIIGDRQTGKTTMAVDAILAQKYALDPDFEDLDDMGMIAVYVGIGQKASSILNIESLLAKNDATRFTIIVATTAAESAALQYLSPYSGCTMAEYFRDKGQAALIVYDDLTKHAAAYRQLSLLLRRPPGREAFPGDVFYAHSRLLERACKLNEDYGLGSLTALPIIETQAGDLSGYIPTNVISITDGQIFLEKDLFFKGIRPAVNVGNSVSRVGSKAQPHPLRLVTANLRYQLAQYREYLVFAQFDNDIDDVTKGILNRGALLTEMLKQGPNKPIILYEQVAAILASAWGFITPFVRDFKKNLNVIADYETSLYTFMNTGDLYKLYEPLFQHYEHTSKDLYGFEDNPMLFVLNYYKEVFYLTRD